MDILLPYHDDKVSYPDIICHIPTLYCPIPKLLSQYGASTLPMSFLYWIGTKQCLRLWNLLLNLMGFDHRGILHFFQTNTSPIHHFYDVCDINNRSLKMTPPQNN